jgi:hypothetical protein
MEVSDHWPCVIEIKTFIPRSRIFRFENCWMEHNFFLPLVEGVWSNHYPTLDPAKLITTKFKALRAALREW